MVGDQRRLKKKTMFLFDRVTNKQRKLNFEKNKTLFLNFWFELITVSQRVESETLTGFDGSRIEAILMGSSRSK